MEETTYSYEALPGGMLGVYRHTCFRRPDGTKDTFLTSWVGRWSKQQWDRFTRGAA